ncbi:transcriptional regulator, TetR family [Agromyces sp. CF514]|uniref:TetR/AcrR family transcriptional regulator n=1 Tax=Agromyces sp. CF514 TaxID=1881031 RepID=UPI0008E6C239|nr:TetR family transcriptional regulator [Agromyces sp. CF514]SFR88278.1 transcriptional regulator, TetR family [Agromyces sp. CF514]
MRIAEAVPSDETVAAPDPTPSDLTTRARLRDAAVECFAAEGFGASVRTIAARAGVSAGLIRHHFGSKDALRAECDEAVLERHRSLKTVGLESPANAMAQLAEADEHGAMLVYILRSVQDGSAAGRAFIEHLIDDAVAYSERAVADGMLRPSLDPVGRARLMVTQSVGGLVVMLSMHPEIELTDFKTVLAKTFEQIALPSIELYTYGVFADESYLNQYLDYLKESS